MSPAAVTRGAATLSMSQPRRADNAATPNVIARTTTDEIAPPATEITAKSTTEMVPATPNATAIVLASTARANEIENVSAIDANTFCPTTVSARRERLNVPVWMAVPSRLPSAPKMLPRMPMAAGMSTSRPGRASSVWVMAPSVSPANRSPPEETRSAALPCRNPATSGPSVARARATIRFGQPGTGTGRLRAASGHGGHRRAAPACHVGAVRERASGVDVDVGAESHRRGIGATGRGQDERERVTVDALPAAADGELVEAIEGQRRRAPAPLSEHRGHVRQRGLEAGAPHRWTSDRGTDVVGVEGGVEPEGLDCVAERAVEPAARGPGPR